MKHWEENSVYILKTLERLEDKLDSLGKDFKEHMQQEDNRMLVQDKQIIKLKADLRWHSRIASGVGSVVAVLASHLLGGHRA